MAGNTLKAYTERFYRLAAPAMKMDLHAAMETWDKGFVIQLFNDGCRRAAVDTGGLIMMGKANLVADQETYDLDASVFSSTPINTLLRVDLYKTAVTDPPIISLVPQYAPDLILADGAVDSGLPTAAAWYFAKHSATESNLELRLSPPPNWGLTSGLQVVASVLPAEITTDTTKPDCQGELGQMGLYDALYNATGVPRFAAAYVNSKRLVMMSGAASQPIVKLNAFRPTRSRWNPKLLTS